MQFCDERQSIAARRASVLHRGLTWASRRAQARLPKAGRAYRIANTPRRVIKRSSFVALRPARRTALRTRTRAEPATPARKQPSNRSDAFGKTSSQRVDSSETWQRPVSSSAEMFLEISVPEIENRACSLIGLYDNRVLKLTLKRLVPSHEN